MSNPGQVNYPVSLDDVIALFAQANNKRTYITNSIDNIVTTIPANTSGFPANGAFSIGSEVVYYTSTDANNFLGCVRGRDGSSPANHDLGAAVELRSIARFWTVLRDAILAIEAKLGVGASTALVNQILAATNTGVTGWTEAPKLEAVQFAGSSQSVAAAGEAKLYYDETLQKFLVSRNTGQYVEIPQVPDTGVITGCALAYSGTGLNYSISAGQFSLKGVVYTCNGGSVTLSAADPTYSRFDQFVLNTDGSVAGITGTPAENPVLPNIDDTTQFSIAFVLIPANAIVPPNTTTTDIYLENTEWTTTTNAPARINVASTNNPRTGTKDIELTGAQNNDYVLFNKGAQQSMTSVSALNLWVRPKASWGGRTIAAQFLGATDNQLGTAVTLGNGRFGFVDTTLSYQQVTIPISSFGLVGNEIVQKLRLRVSGGGASIGAYIDDINLQVEALASQPQFADLNVVIDGGGAAITIGVKLDVVVDFGCTILSATLLADQTGSIVVDIWKDSYNNYPPTAADSITAAAKPTLSSAIKSQDNALTGWNTTIGAGEVLRFNVDSATTVQRVTLILKLRRT